ncbi:MAG: hypothetical protein C0418_03615 [Coriobacteriaceae bacterium]|nr:hypothetical protein [Coriobacteriaceae bacterium]
MGVHPRRAGHGAGAGRDGKGGAQVIDEDALRALAAAVGDPVVSMDISGRVLSWNAAASELWGWEPSEAIGSKLPHIAKERRTTMLAEIRRAAGGVVQVEEITERKDGTRLRATLTLLPVTDDEGAVGEVISVMGGMTSDSRVDLVLGEQVELVSAEFRRHVTALLGYGQLLSREEVQTDPSKRGRVVRALESRGAQMAALMEDLSVLERFQTGVLRPVFAPTDLTGVVADAIGTVERSVPGCRFSVEYDPSLPTILADARLLTRAVEKVLTQASEACAEGDRVEVWVAREGPEAIVGVRVPGDRDETGASPVPRAGVGLAILWRIAEVHAGSVTVRPVPGGGAETVLRLPVGGPDAKATA